MSINVNQLVTVGQLGNLATRTVTELNKTFKSAKVENGTVNFYTSSDTTGTATFTFNLSSDTYTASDTSLTISGSDIKVNIDSDTNNILTLTAGGLFVDGSNLSVDVSGKINKVQNATAGNLPILASDGSITDSTYGIATLAEVTEYLDTIFPVSNGD